MQNIPREYKRLFWSGDDDYLLGEADAAQLEFRVAADLSHDPVATEMLCTDGDVHTDTAKVFVDWNKNNPDDPHPDFIDKDYKSGRQLAKARTFAPLFGGQGQHQAEKEYSKFFREKYHVINETQRGWAIEVLNTGKLVTRYGMQFFWPGTKASRSGYIDNTTSIFNFPIQGFATGEIIPIALVCFWHRSKDLDLQIINTIHDSVVSRVHKDCVEEYKKLSVQCFTYDVFKFLREVYSYDFVTPLGAGVKVSRNWGDADKETQYNVFSDGRYTVKEK